MPMEAACSYCFPPRISRELVLRQEGLPRESATRPRRFRRGYVPAYCKLSKAGKLRRSWLPRLRAKSGFVWATEAKILPAQRVGCPRRELTNRCSRRTADPYDKRQGGR
jgi:hypothetical protein